MAFYMPPATSTIAALTATVTALQDRVVVVERGHPVFTADVDGIAVTIPTPEWIIDAEGDPRLLAVGEAAPVGSSPAVSFYDIDGDLNIVVPGGLV